MNNVPKSFFEVFPALKLEGILKSLCEQVEVEKVTSNKMGNRIKVYIVSKKLVQKEQLFCLEKNIKEQLFPRSNVNIVIVERFELSEAYTPKNLFDAYEESILEEFGLDKNTGHIVNGHVPVVTKKGESPIKCGGKLLVIDGGFAKAYHAKTGIAGYTLVYHSRGFQLIQHEPFTSMQKAIEEGQDIKSSTQIVEMSTQRMMVKDTDRGRELRAKVEDLKKLLAAYRIGLIKEKNI